MTGEIQKRKPGRPKGSRSAEKIIKTNKIQQVLTLSEDHLIKVLKGTIKVPEKLRTGVALEIYKRRVPTKVETDGKSDKLTLIKIVKNHVPQKLERAEEIEEAVDAVLSNTEPEEIRRAVARSRDEVETRSSLEGETS